MAVISDSGLEREVLRHIVPRRAISVPRLTRRIPGVLTLIPVVVDCLSIAVAYLLVGIVDPIPASAIVVLCLLLAGTYRRRLTLSGLDIAPAVVVAASAGAILSSTVNGANGIRDLVVPVGAACVAVFTGRVVACSLTRRLRRLTALRSRVVVVGADPVGIALTQRILEEPEYGLEPVLVIDDEAVVTNVPSQRVPLRAAQSTTELLLSAERIDTVVMAFHRLDDTQIDSLLALFDRMGCDIFVVPRMWDSCPGGDRDRVGAVPIVRVHSPMHRNRLRYIKGASDRCVAAVALLMLSPVLAAVAVAQKVLHPREPVLFRQTRVGQHGREFELIKFRSMTPDNDREAQTTWTIVGDSRIDAFGRFLRASSIDELPQLWNIVRGDMALIGPRPERPHFVAQFSASIPGYPARHRVPVGLTGWAAVSGLSGDTSITERVRYDNFYITHWSLWFDVKITLRTLWTLIIRFRQGRSEDRAARTAGRIPWRVRIIHPRAATAAPQTATEPLCQAG
jgi:exopolysaccharide biosynthesis polyprenyl glycosylphosphotransferase